MEQLRTRQLVQIVDLSRQMLELAGALQWDQVTELEAQRKQLVLACFQNPASEQDAEEVGAAIREILQLNEQISELGRDCRAQLGGEIRNHKLRSNAATAYLSNARR